ncbi:hypothetical protein CHS0354_033716 [Potamilus streckersoni]|uniref:Guided entry of tail-anchored proteins factor 1 n=1 Tax=Potamilus streckersoni TaxID=2493646 RepID=A0AAE0S2U8_9BIVA|nr:hypothetical protein CHS0354_033716 [Potamilus streckersoni]
MFLMILILFLVIIFSYLPGQASALAKSIGNLFFSITDEELNLRSQLRDLKMEQGSISITDEFARYMKLQRKINSFTDAIKKFDSTRTKQMMMLTVGVKTGIYVLHGLIMVSLTLAYKNEPLLQLPWEWFTPINKLVAFPTGVPGGVGVTCWILVCSSVVYRMKTFLQVT